MKTDVFSSSPTVEKAGSIVESQNGLENVENQEENSLYTVEEERAVVKKIDMVIMPLVSILIFFLVCFSSLYREQHLEWIVG